MIREMNPSPLHAAPSFVHTHAHTHAPRSAPQYRDGGVCEKRLWKTLVLGGYLLPWLQTEMEAAGKRLSRALDTQSSWALPVDLQAGATAAPVSWAPGFCMHVQEGEWAAACEAGLLIALFCTSCPLNNAVFLLLGDFQSIPSRHFSASPSPVAPLQILPSP